MPDVIVGPREELVIAFRRVFADAAAATIALRGRFLCAVPGGSAAETLLPALVDLPVDWPRVHVFWADERLVAPTDAQSNYGLANRPWLQHVPIVAAHVHPMRPNGADLDASADTYAKELAQEAGAEGRLDLILLGMGADGHVCSLFPDHRVLAERQRLVAAVPDAPKPPAARLTLTLPVLEAAGLLVIAAFGHEKAAAVHAALEIPDATSPAAMAIRGAERVVCLLDAGAASRLRRP